MVQSSRQTGWLPAWGVRKSELTSALGVWQFAGGGGGVVVVGGGVVVVGGGVVVVGGGVVVVVVVVGVVVVVDGVPEPEPVVPGLHRIRLLCAVRALV